MAKDKKVKTADEARKAATESSAAYAQVGASSPIGQNMWLDENNPYVKFYASSDDLQRRMTFQDLYRGLTSQPSVTGSGNLWNDIQSLLRSTGYSKGKTAAGIPDTSDVDALREVIGRSIDTNSPDILSFLTAVAASGGRGTDKEIKQQDTTTKFVRQVTSALRLMDVGDATKKYTDAMFAAYGIMPDESGIKQFQKAWNAEERVQKVSTATESVTKYAKVYDTKSEKVIDKKTGKQKIDRFNQPVYKDTKKNADGTVKYKPITSQDTFSPGQGFTAEEQEEFMADYLAANFPDIADAEGLGGAARVIYDSIVKLDQDNYQEVSNFASIAPVIKQVIASGNPEVAQEYLRKYQEDVRKRVAQQYMSIGNEVKEGTNAKAIVQPIVDKVSAAFEESVNINDPFVKMVLNYQDPDSKEYRIPNEQELTGLLMKDSRSMKTSAFINSAVNVVQTLRGRLRG